MGRATAAVHVCALLIMLGAPLLLRGDTLAVVTSPAAQGANDSVAWSQLGADATVLSSGFVATSGLGMGVTAGLTAANSLTAVVCPATPCSWTGTGSSPGDTLIWTSDAGNGGNGPLTLTFAQGVSGAGALIQADGPGPFTAQIQAFNGTTLLGSFTVASNSNGDATYLGVTDQTGSNITSVTFSLTSCTGVCTDFAVDTVGIASGPSFPLTVSLAGSGSGAVTSSPSGVNCPSVCSVNFTSGQSVTLTASPAAGSSFAGWSGACSGTGTCTVSMNSSQAVTATFSAVAGTPVVTLSASSLGFPGQLLGTTSNAKTVTLTNTGTAGLLLSPIVPSGDYLETDNCPVSPSALAANGACKISVTFEPSVPGALAGEITISDNAGNTPQMINLSGTGLAPLSLSTTSISFGSTVTVGTTTAGKIVTLTNNTSAPLGIAYAASADYTSNPGGTTPCGSSLAAKSKCTLSVTFTPSQNGVSNGAVTVTYSGSFNPQEVSLSGTGSGGATSPLSFSPASLTFTGQLLGTTSLAKTVTITNNSASAVTLAGSLPTSGDYTAQGSGGTPCPGATLAATGGKCTFTVTFSPSINASIKGAVAIADNAAVSPQIYNLSGTGALPLSLAPASLAFTAQTAGTTSPEKVVTLTNNLSTAVSLALIASGDFTVDTGITGGCSTTLAGLGVCKFAVSFTPGKTGTIQGVVTITYSGSGFSPQVLKVTGTGK
ncbi:MAG TPA: choice-of-anchor D domain-containing protein [Terriglobales bacterium]|nr:choice-of-anchor D domain-containing protein [Terriglobales bacterium]